MLGFRLGRKRGEARPIYYLHIPKTGGSNIRDLMARAFGDKFCPAGAWDDFFRHPEYRSDPYEAYGGHFGNDLSDFLGRDLRIFSVLREPVARTISHYLHVKRDIHHPLNHLLAGRSLKEFVFDPIGVALVYNFQARYIARSIDRDMDRLAAIYTPFWASQYSLSVAWEQSNAYLQEEQLEELAMKGFENLEFAIATDEIEQNVDGMQRLWGRPVEYAGRKNVAPSRPDDIGIDAETRQRIAALTAIDAKLYAQCKVRRAA